MPIDASIALGVQQPNTMQTLSSMIGLKTQLQQQQLQQQSMQSNDMANQQSAIALQERQGVQGVLKNINSYKDIEGNIDFNKLGADVYAVAPTTGSQVMQGVTQAQTAATNAKAAVNGLDADTRSQVGNILYSLKGQDPMVAHNTMEGLKKTYPNLAPAVDFMGKYIIGPTVKDKSAFDSSLDAAGRFVQTATAQAPTVAMVPTSAGTQPYNTNALSPGGQGPVGEPLTPPNQVASTTSGGAALVNPATGTAKPFAQAPGATMDFPAGENKDTQAELQQQRTQSQQVANQAPTLHNINRGIVSLIDTGTTTGKLQQLGTQVSSAFGGKFEFGDDTASNYNTLGKLLERSALTASQGMGPHTNAGLEAQVRANGSTDYTPQALRKIATLNDALTTGTSLYQNGLENTIKGQGGSVFAKRQFDQQWANTMNPTNGVDGVQALRLKNAVDNGDQVEKASILKEVGGSGSKGAQVLLQKLRSLQQLSGSQQ